MLLPLMFLILSVIGYTILGLLFLSCVPRLRVTFLNLILFLLGAFVGGLALLFFYGRLFARTKLDGTTFYGIFPVLLIGGLLGGGFLLWFRGRFGRPA
jgi:hypothetical protein